IVDSEGNVQDKISVELPDKQIVTVDNQIQLPTDYPDKAVEARLQAIEQTQSQILDKLNDTIDTRLTGSNMEYYSKDEATMPSANSVPLGAFCMVVDTGNIWQSDGTDWKVFA